MLSVQGFTEGVFCHKISDDHPLLFMTASKTALVLIDMQNDVLASIVKTGASVVPAIQKALHASREKGVCVIHCLRIHRASGVDVEKFRLEEFLKNPILVPGTPGAEVIPELKPLPEEYQVSKSRFSGFFQTDLLMILQRLGVSTVAVVGVQTPNCVRATVTDALAYDFDVVVIDDAICAQTPEIHRANVYDMVHMGAKQATVDEFIDSLS